MYENLWSELHRRRITYKEVGALLNIHENSVYNKIHGNTLLSLEEAKKYTAGSLKMFLFWNCLKERGGEADEVCARKQTRGSENAIRAFCLVMRHGRQRD